MIKKTNSIASDITNKLSLSTKFQVNLVQPQYLLYRDTIKSFFYEKKEQIAAGDKALAYFGISLSTFISICSTTFNDLLFFKAKYLEQIFYISCAVSFLLFIKYSVFYFLHRKGLSAEALTDEIAKRSSATMSGDEQ